MADITITLSRGDIVLRAKDETYLSSRAFLVTEQANANARYEMQADEKDTHERKLLASIRNAVADLKSKLNEYLLSGDVDSSKDTVTLTVTPPEGFKGSYRTNVIAVLAEEYITRRVIAEWWDANYPSQAKKYDALALATMEQLRNAFYYKGEATRKTFNS
jgi:hypothetical protein